MTALTRHQREAIEADREAEYQRVVSRNTPARARHLIRRAFVNFPDGVNMGYAALAYLQWSGDADTDAQTAIDRYWAAQTPDTYETDVDEWGNEFCLICGDLIDNHGRACKRGG